MSHVCAKPACTQPVQVWLDFVPASQQVVEQSTRSEVSVGLCDVHAERFSMPAGWTLRRLADSETDTVESLEAQSRTDIDTDTVEIDSAEVPTNRAHSRGRPWFLANSSVELGDDDGFDSTVTREPADTKTVGELHLDEPTAGSLLHRAFHGPNRVSDDEPAAPERVEDVDELEPRRRAARSSRQVHGNGMAELPFPPFEPEHRVAVS